MNFAISWLFLFFTNITLQIIMEVGFRKHIDVLDVSTVMIIGFVGLGVSSMALVIKLFLLLLKKEKFGLMLLSLLIFHFAAFAHSCWILYHFIPQFFLNQ